MNRRNFFNKAAMFVAGCALALKCSTKLTYPDYTKIDPAILHSFECKAFSFPQLSFQDYYQSTLK